MKRGRQGKRHKTTRWHGVNVDIPLDLTLEILKKLPAKSLVRFQCVSKLWSSIITGSRDFIESIITRSSTQPPCDGYLLFYQHSDNPLQCSLTLSSSTIPLNTYKVPQLSVHAHSCQYIRGLIFCWSLVPKIPVIYNPTTRQSLYLPEMKNSHVGTYYFGYDSLKNQYKLLFLPRYSMQTCQVFTLGDPTCKQWRTIQGVRYHFPLRFAVCINGVIYYRAKNTPRDFTSLYKLMSFDLKSEEFRHVDAPKTLMDHASTLINYQGKLGFIVCFQNGMEIWVREDCDLKTQGWSKIFFYEMDGFTYEWRVTGANRGGDILFVHSKHLGVFYYDPKRNSMRYVDLEDTYLGQRRRDDLYFIEAFSDYAENTMRLF